MTPWWVTVVSVSVGGILGGAFSLWGVKIVQDRTDSREAAKIEAEQARELRKLDSEKPSRLRPDRISILYEIGEMLHDFDAPLGVISGRSEHDEERDWMAVAAEAGNFTHRHRKMDIRVRLLFQYDDGLIAAWDNLDTRLRKLDTTVEYGSQWVTPSWLKDLEANERAHWSLIMKAAGEAQLAADQVDDAINAAMRRIDTE
ncbi:hypothetical protein ACFY36_23485 [Actinoplanes sp. NPDC000266]